MRQLMVFLTFTVLSTSAVRADVSTKERARIREAATVLQEIHTVPDKDIPKELWDRAACVLVVPSLKKAAFVVGGEYGKGLMSCRQDGDWSAPVFMEIGKGSWGLQIGAQSIDLVLLVMNSGGMEKLLRNKVSLGVEASVSEDRSADARAATDAQLKAEILSIRERRDCLRGSICRAAWSEPTTMTTRICTVSGSRRMTC